MGEQWRGPDALTGDNLAEDFWRQVSEPAKPEEFAKGIVITLEVTHDGEVLTSKMVRVTEVVHDEKGHHVQFEDVKPDEPYEDSGIVLGVPV